MKNWTLVAAVVGMMTMVAPSGGFAKGDKAAKPEGAAKEKKAPNFAKVFKEYDTNGNGILDDTEKEAIRTAFAGKDKKVKALDANRDKVLSEDELAAVKPAEKKGKKNK